MTRSTALGGTALLAALLVLSGSGLSLAAPPRARVGTSQATSGAQINAYLSGLAAHNLFSGTVLVARHGPT